MVGLFCWPENKEELVPSPVPKVPNPVLVPSVPVFVPNPVVFAPNNPPVFCWAPASKHYPLYQFVPTEFM